MRRLLIVSPNFPPVNAADMQRIRISLPHFEEFGWQPRVLAVEPDRVQGVREPLLLESVPSQVPVHHCGAFDISWTRKIGITALALRALPFLYRAGARLIREHHPDLIFFSTTAFPVLALGRLWKQRFGVPFVVDMQDPWVSESHGKRQSLKHRLARSLHRLLEPFTMRAADGIIAVSTAYHETLRKRYPWLRADLCRTIPFGASENDFEIAERVSGRNSFFSRNGMIHGVYVGRGGADLRKSLSALFGAWREGLRSCPELFRRLRLHFIGTDYAPPGRERKTIWPVAEEFGLADVVVEYPLRIPYFETLKVLLEADFLVVPGSDDAQYTASKIYPYVLARKPMLAVFHEASSVVEVLRTTNAGEVVTFSTADHSEVLAETILPIWTRLLGSLPFTPATNWKAFEPYLAREMTRRQCELFDRVLEQTGSK